MSKKLTMKVHCDAPGCEETLVIPIVNGQPTPDDNTSRELDRWVLLRRNDGTEFDYCRQRCHINGAQTLAPIERKPPAAPPQLPPKTVSKGPVIIEEPVQQA